MPTAFNRKCISSIESEIEHMRVNRWGYITNVNMERDYTGIVKLDFNGVAIGTFETMRRIRHMMYSGLSLWVDEWMCLYCGSPQALPRTHCEKCGAPRSWVIG